MIVTYVTTNNKQSNIYVGENSLESLLHKFMCISYCGHRYAHVNHICYVFIPVVPKRTNVCTDV